MYDKLYSEIFITGRKGIARTIMHKLLESGDNHKHFSQVLEIGANQGEHFSYVKHTFDRYLMTDVQDRINESLLTESVEFELADVCNLHYESNYFDKITVTCVLQHVQDPEAALIHLLRCLRPGGTCRILLMCDSKLSFRLIRSLTTLRKAKKFGLLEEVEVFFAREHRNDYIKIIKLAEYNFKGHKLVQTSWPFRFWQMEIFRVLELTKL